MKRFTNQSNGSQAGRMYNGGDCLKTHSSQNVS